MPRTGGARVGSGPKPKPRWDDEMPLIVPDASVSEDPPMDLPSGQREFWVRCAKVAIAKGTLTSQTVEAFRLLCELDEERAETKREMERSGRIYEKVWVDSSGQEHAELKLHPLVNHYRALAKQEEISMMKFCLVPFGKPVTPVRSTGDRKRAAARTRFFGQEEKPAKSA